METDRKTTLLDSLTATQRRHAMSEGPLSKAERQAIVKAVEQYIASTSGMNYSKLSRIIDVGRTTLTKTLKGDYRGDVDKVLRLCRTFLEKRDSAVLDVPDFVYAETSIGRQIRTICELAVDQPSIGIVKAPAGVGKTTALREVERRLGRSQAVYLRAGEAFATKRELLLELADRLNISTARTANAFSLYRAVRSRLAGHFAGGAGLSFLVIVDEARTLRPNAINLLRDLHDDPATQAAIVLADTINRMDDCLYASASRGITGGNEQLRRRATACYTHPAGDAISPADVRAVANAYAKSLGYAGKLGRHAHGYLHKIANREGALGNVTAALHQTYYTAVKLGRQPEFSVAELDAVRRELGGRRGELNPTHAAAYDAADTEAA